ncbi:MAG: hypothetical protein R3234_08935 [Thermoanaerobaculia bacterium]|nr:hypothetical protein [Thermoanaerobaculia bacterium]
MTPLLPGIWFLFLALVSAWIVRRLDDLPRRVVGGALGLSLLILAPVLFRGLVLASPRIDSVPPFGGDPTAAVSTLRSAPAVRILPLQREVRRLVLEGSPPFWYADHGTGTPLLAAPEAQVAQPLAFVAWPFPPGPGLAVTAAFQLFVALLFGWLALRRFTPFGGRAGGGAAFAGSVVYAVIAVLPVHGWPRAHVAALFPALVYALCRLRDDPGRRHRFFAVLVVAAVLLAGAPRPAVVALVSGLVLLWSHLVPLRPSGRLLPFGRSLGALAVGAALSAPVLLPAALWVPRTEGHLERAEERLQHLREDPLGLEALRLHQAGKPSWGGGEDPWRQLGRGSVLLLAALGLVSALGPASRWRPAIGPLILGGVAWAVVLAPASFLGVLHYFHLAPDDVTGSPVWFVVAFVVALLLAAGLTRLEARVWHRPREGELMGAALVTAEVLLFVGIGEGGSGADEILGVAGAAFLTAALVLVRILRPRARIALLLLALPVVEVVFGARPLPVTSAEAFQRSAPGLEALRTAPGGSFRTAVVGPSLPPGMALLRDLPDARAIPGLRPASYARLVAPLERPEGFFAVEDDPLYDLLAVRRLLGAGDAPTERPRALPLFFLPASVQPFPGGDWSRALSRIDDFHRTASVQRSADVEPGDAWRAETPEDDRLWVEHRGDGRWILRAILHEPRLLASSLHQDGGWRLRLDGDLHPTLLANGPFLAAWLPAGDHRLELVYRPPGLPAGTVLGLGGLAALLVFVRDPRAERDGSR